MKLELQNPLVLLVDDVGYCMDEDGDWYRWKTYPIAKSDSWVGGVSTFINPEDAPITPDDYKWNSSWHDNPLYVKPGIDHAEADRILAGGLVPEPEVEYRMDDEIMATPYPDPTKLTPESMAAIHKEAGMSQEPLSREELLATAPLEGYFDEVNKAKHYNVHPSGVECIEVIEHFQCNIANAMKYLWRAGEKHDDPLMDLEKAEYYVKRQIALYHLLKEKQHANTGQIEGRISRSNGG